MIPLPAAFLHFSGILRISIHQEICNFCAQELAKANGIHKKIGWHTFRHSFGTLLKANREDVKTVPELLPHANSRITLDVYTQAVNSNKRAAQSKVVRMMVSSAGAKVANVGTTDPKKQAQNAG